MFDFLAHSLRLRKFLERGPIALFKQFKKLTVSTSFDYEIQKISHQKAALYATTTFCEAIYCSTKSQLYGYIKKSILRSSNSTKSHTEFGVFQGQSINFFADSNPNLQWVGFDCFEGLPEHWSGTSKTKEHFSTKGKLPKVSQNVKLIKGLFEYTVPKWVETNPGKLAFVHLDADLYSSTQLVLQSIKELVEEDTLFLFDEYFGYVGWENGEHKAWIEWLDLNQYSAECIAFAGNGTALFRLKK